MRYSCARTACAILLAAAAAVPVLYALSGWTGVGGRYYLIGNAATAGKDEVTVTVPTADEFYDAAAAGISLQFASGTIALEPTTSLLIGIGLVSLGYLAKRRT